MMRQTEAAQVGSVRKLYERFRQLIHEGAKFGVVGVIGVIITDGGTNLLRAQYHLGWLWATTIATIVATCFAFVASRYWTFKHRERTSVPRETALFFLLNAIGLLIQLAPLGFTVHVLGRTANLPANIALVVGIGLGTIFRFWAYRKFVWTAKRPDPPAGHEDLEPVLTPAPSSTAPSGDEAGKPH